MERRYERLPYEQYFLDTSQNYNHTERAVCPLEYENVSYPCRGTLRQLLGLRHEVDYAFRYDPERDVIQIHFQKTTGFMDWIANFEFAANYYDAISFEDRPLQLRVHRGWAEMYLAAKRQVRAQWQLLHEAHPTAETEIIGWSLGSGQAILCAQDLNYNFGLRSRLITYGSVKPFRARAGEAELLARYLGSVCAFCVNIADHNDIVGYMPPFRGCTDIRRVWVGLQKRSLLRLMQPRRYHTHYDDPALYRELPER